MNIKDLAILGLGVFLLSGMFRGQPRKEDEWSSPIGNYSTTGFTPPVGSSNETNLSPTMQDISTTDQNAAELIEAAARDEPPPIVQNPTNVQESVQNLQHYYGSGSIEATSNPLEYVVHEVGGGTHLASVSGSRATQEQRSAAREANIANLRSRGVRINR